MAIVFDTIVVRFGEAATAGDLFAVLELDDTKNIDIQGNVLTSFAPGAEVHFILHTEPGVEIVRADLTSGDLSILAPEIRTRTPGQRAFFVDNDTVINLRHFFLRNLNFTWYGRNGIISTNGRQLKSSLTPAIADISYEYLVTPITVLTPDVPLVGEEVYPIGLRVTVQ